MLILIVRAHVEGLKGDGKPEEVKKRPRYAYFPFSGGPRQCIGDNFARMEARIALATLIQRFQPVILPGYPIEIVPSVTLRPRHGVMAKIAAVH